MGRRKHGNASGSGTPSSKRKRSAPLRRNVSSPDNNMIEASDVPDTEEAPQAEEENKDNENASSPQLQKEGERDRGGIQSEKSKSENPEKAKSFAVEENLESEEEMIINQVFDQAPASTLTGESERNPVTFVCTLSDNLLIGSVKETRINPHNIEDDGAGDSRTPRKSTSQEFVPNTQFFRPDSPSFVTICNDEHIKPQILMDYNTDDNITSVPEKRSSIYVPETFSEVEINNSQETQATINIQGRHLACCNLVAVLTSQNDALQNAVHGLKNELASLSFQMFDLEARCGNLESTNQQLLCRIRDYEDLGSREEIIRCGEQIGQFTEFLQAMLQDTTRTMNKTFGAGSSFFHPLQ